MPFIQAVRAELVEAWTAQDAPLDKFVLSEPLALRQAQGEREVEEVQGERTGEMNSIKAMGDAYF